MHDERNKKWFWDSNDIFDAGLSHYALVVRLYLARCADNTSNRKSFPSAKNIAEKCGISRRKVFDALEELCSRGLLDKIPRSKTGKDETRTSRDSNLYILKSPIGSAQHAPPPSAPEEPGVVHDTHQGSAQGALGVVHEVHSELDLLELDSFKDSDDKRQAIPGTDISQDAAVLVMLYHERNPVSGAQAVGINRKRNEEITAALKSGCTFEVIERLIKENAAAGMKPWDLREMACKECGIGARASPRNQRPESAAKRRLRERGVI